MDVEQAVAEHDKLAWYWAHQFKRRIPGSVISVDDLVQEARLGLMDAAQRFDETKGASFPTFASYRIQGALKDYCRSQDFLSRRDRERVSRGDAEANAVMAPPLSLDLLVSELGDATPLLGSSGLDPGFGKVDDQETIRACLEHLSRTISPRDQLILECWLEGWTQVRIAELCNLTEGRVSQVMARILERCADWGRTA